MIRSLKQFIVIALLWVLICTQAVILNGLEYPKVGVFFFGLSLGVVLSMTVNKLRARD